MKEKYEGTKWKTRGARIQSRVSKRLHQTCLEKLDVLETEDLEDEDLEGEDLEGEDLEKEVLEAEGREAADREGPLTGLKFLELARLR